MSERTPSAENDAPHQHDEVPDNPSDGDRFTCARCGYTAEFVVLDDGLPGEWVSATPPEFTHCANCGAEVPVGKPHKVGECALPPGGNAP